MTSTIKYLSNAHKIGHVYTRQSKSSIAYEDKMVKGEHGIHPHVARSAVTDDSDMYTL